MVVLQPSNVNPSSAGSEGFGIAALDLDAADDARSALEAALRTPGPMLIHASINMHEQVLPMVAPGAANKDMIGG